MFTITYWGTVRSRTIVHNHLRETQHCCEWYTCTKITQKSVLCAQYNQLTYCYTNVSNTALVLAVWLLNENQLLCPEWVTDWRSATFGTVRETSPGESRSWTWVTVQMWFTSSAGCSRTTCWGQELRYLLRITFVNVSDFYCVVKSLNMMLYGC